MTMSLNLSLKSDNILWLVQGGLGNQLSQYLIVSYLSKKLGRQLFLNDSLLTSYSRQLRGITSRSLSSLVLSQNINQFHCGLIDRIKIRFFIRFNQYLKSSNILSDDLLLNLDRISQITDTITPTSPSFICKFHGYTSLLFDQLLENEWSSLNHLIDQQAYPVPSNSSACIHIRAGDYLNHPYFISLNAAYYSRAICHLNKLGISKFTVFTDSREHASSILNNINFQHLLFDDYSSSESTFCQISRYKYIITANSSFSSIAAYLAQIYFGFNDSVIIAPRYWTNSTSLNQHKSHQSSPSFIQIDNG